MWTRLIYSKYVAFELRLFLQEFINHDGTIFKIYVLGEHTHVVSRVSLPNFPALGVLLTEQELTNKGVPETEIVTFDSQKWKHELPPHLTTATTGKLAPPSPAEVKDFSKTMSELLVCIFSPLHLFFVLLVHFSLFANLSPAVTSFFHTVGLEHVWL